MIGLTGITYFSDNNLNLNKLGEALSCTFKGKHIQSVNHSNSNCYINIFDEDLAGNIYENDEIMVVVAGDLYEEEYLNNSKTKASYLSQVFITDGPEACVGMNGSFIFLVYQKKKSIIYIGTDRNSFIPFYYTYYNSTLYFSWDMETLLTITNKQKKINYENLFFWILVGGLGVGDDTRFQGISKLEPGSFISINSSSIKKNKLPPFQYNPKTISYQNLLDDTIHSLYDATKCRVSKLERLGIGLSGGIDSRIVLAAAKKEYNGELFSYTHGISDFAENDIAQKVANYYGIRHIFMELPNLIYKDYAHDGVFFSGGNSLFKHGVQIHLFNTLKMKENAQGILQGSALDCSAGNAWMTDEIYSFNNREQLFQYYIDTHILKFSKDEFRNLFIDPKVADKLYRSTIDRIKAGLDTIPGDVIPDINTSFFYEMRGNRHYNIDLNYIMYSHRLITPTYDLNFLNSLSSVPHAYRRNDKFRVDLLIALDKDVSNIPYDYTMQPAWVNYPHTIKFKKILDEIERTQLKIWFDSGRNVYIPSKRWDANFLEWIRVYPQYRKFFFDLLTDKDSILGNQILNKKSIEKIINDHHSGKKEHHKLLTMLVSSELTYRVFLKGETENVHTDFVDFSHLFL